MRERGEINGNQCVVHVCIYMTARKKNVSIHFFVSTIGYKATVGIYDLHISLIIPLLIPYFIPLLIPYFFNQHLIWLVFFALSFCLNLHVFSKPHPGCPASIVLLLIPSNGYGCNRTPSGFYLYFFCPHCEVAGFLPLES